MSGYSSSGSVAGCNQVRQRQMARIASRAAWGVALSAVLLFTAPAAVFSKGPLPRQGAEGPAADAGRATARLVAGPASSSKEVRSAAAVNMLLSRASMLQEAGFRLQAVDDLEAASLLARRLDDRMLMASAARALGSAYLRAGRLSEARHTLEDALRLGEQTGRPSMMAATLNDWGNLLSAERSEEQALAAYRRSHELARVSAQFGLASAAANNAAQLELKRNNIRSALDFIRSALRSLGELPDSRDKAAGLLNAGRSLQDVHRLTRDTEILALAHASLSAAGRMAETQRDLRTAAYAWGYTAQLYAEQERVAEALDLTRKAVFLAQQAQAPESLYRWEWQAGRMLKAHGKPLEALASYRRAIQDLVVIRQDLMTDLRAQRRSYRETVGPLFLEFADLLLLRAANSGAGKEAQQYLVEARDLIEQLKAVELEDYFQDDCVAGLLAKQKAVEQLDTRTAVLYPIIFPDRVEMLIGFSTGLERVTLAVSADALAKDILNFRQKLEKRSTHEYLPPAKRLYDALIRPIETKLQSHEVDTLVLVPDGSLRSIPLGALHDGVDFLISRYAIATVPGLTLIEPHAIEHQEMRLLLSGLTQSVQNFPALPHVADEMQVIQSLQGGKLLEDESFVMANLERELKNVAYSVVHIASHGQFDSDPRKSFLLTYDGKLSMDHLEQLMKFSRFRENPVELLTLSACRTAVGDDRAALGLAGVAIKAGARSALATLWYINDQASSLLIADFYRELAAAPLSKAKALQKAQRNLLSDPRYRHPGYWSPFLLIGNWL